MKKIRYFTAAAMSVCLWAANMVPAFAWESVSMETDFATGYIDEGEYENDNLVSIELDSPVVATLQPSQIRGGGSHYTIAWDTTTEEQKLLYLTSVTEPDNDALTWWVNSAYDDATKFQYLNGVTKTGTESSMWVIQSSIPLADKVSYFHTHRIRYNSPEVFQWWWTYVGNVLTTAQTTKTDAYNYESYLRVTTHTTDGLDVISYSEKNYYIATADLQACMDRGIVRTESYSYTWGGDDWSERTLYYLTVDPLQAGCKLWSLE